MEAVMIWSWASDPASIYHQTFRSVPKMEESENLYKLYGYGLCKGQLIPKMAEHKVQ